MESASKETVVFFDTNMLLAIAQFKVDVFEELKKMFGNVSFKVPKQIELELNSLVNKNRKTQIAVEIAKRLMKNNSVMVVDLKAKNADDALMRVSKQGFVATNDRILRKKIKAFGGKVIYLRKRKVIEIEGD